MLPRNRNEAAECRNGDACDGKPTPASRQVCGDAIFPGDAQEPGPTGREQDVWLRMRMMRF